MLIHILGSCSGTEPMAGRDYTSWILEENCGDLIWFDAGGICASHAYLKGLSPLKVKALFISHPHLDHTAGIPGIFQAIQKEKWLRKIEKNWQLPCYTSTPELFEYAIKFADLSLLDSEINNRVVPIVNELTPGKIFQDSEIEVDTLPNLHLPLNPKTGKPRSYSYRIRTSEKNIVYTGDVKSIDELATWLENPTELLMAETGHHNAANICKRIRDHKWPVKRILFVHHGQSILKDPVNEKNQADDAWGESVLFAVDGMAIPLD